MTLRKYLPKAMKPMLVLLAVAVLFFEWHRIGDQVGRIMYYFLPG
ncbi:hypothetical protein [Massilia niastensis]|nr:hypothetical protein [Massilia niastensis]